MCEYTVVPGKSVSYSAAMKAFKTMLVFAGLDPKRFGLHSPRIGGATDAFRNNVPSTVIDKIGRWKSSDSKYAYLRYSNGHLLRSMQTASSYR